MRFVVSVRKRVPFSNIVFKIEEREVDETVCQCNFGVRFRCGA